MDRKHRPFLSLLALMTLALGIVLSGCGSDNKPSSSGQSGGELVVAYDSDVTNFDPILGSSGNDHAMLYLAYETLVNYNGEMQPQPGLAKSWEFSDDKKTITLHLQENVKFQDGTDFNAEAVKFNIERANSDSSKVSDLKNVESVEAADPHTVKIHLKQPDSSIILALSDRAGMMVSPAAVKKYGNDYSQHPVGAGPFKMVNWVHSGEIQYEKFADYWQKDQVHLNKITVKIMPDENSRLNALKSGQVQFYWNVSPDNYATLQNDSSITLSGKMTFLFANIYLNTTKPPFDNKNVRLALLYGIDRPQIVKGLFNGIGEPAYSTFPSGYWAHSDQMVPYDPDKAKQYLQNSGLSIVSFDMEVAANARDQRIAEAVQQQLKQIGITVNIKPAELTKAVATYFSEKQVPAFLSYWTGRPDPQQTVNLFLGSKGFYNAGGYTVPEKESLISQAAQETDQVKRAKLYDQINKIAIVQEAMDIPILFLKQTGAMNSHVKGFEPTALGKPRFAFLRLE
ncbi:ABC transporter substrate-binding protein [Effusibacillus dendaii]|uniref:ABC transporter substrate-binding protein n=1 Tax=Effusibacillus dendaii TaxID=2743772 RepID=A0A7I8D698_9BACL|nr:ABC transporter substrate-binding protein [Effusibacillus dendaii]BCJ85517.1 ABC transporter substrate-binding protein [Effusibacillus dendaii]